MGIWLYTLHWALRAHVPGHGFTHLLREQTLSKGQSVFVTHSGLQPT